MTRAEQQAYADLRKLREAAERAAHAAEDIAKQMALWGIALDRVATIAGGGAPVSVPCKVCNGDGYRWDYAARPSRKAACDGCGGAGVLRV